MTEAATVTVIVPTYNRRDFLPDVVAALKAQTYPSFSAVIVDDGSTDGTVAVITAAIAGDRRFFVHSQPNTGPAAARNLACRDAVTHWLAFTDDDCVPQPSWLASLLDTAATTGADVVQGRTISDPLVRRADLPWFARGKTVGSWSRRFETCNLLIRSSQLREIGGFDETFPPRGFGEDTDVGLRLVQAGATTAFASGAVVQHRVLPMTFVEFLQRRYRWAQVVHLVAVNPDARSNFPHRYVAQRSHLAFWLALPLSIWALLNGRWMVPMVGVVGFAAYRAKATNAEGRTLTIRIARAPLELIGVGVEAVGFVVESVRHRCLLL